MSFHAFPFAEPGKRLTPRFFALSQVSDEDVGRLVLQSIPSTTEMHPDFDKFSFTPRVVGYEQTPAAVLAMMNSMELASK